MRLLTFNCHEAWVAQLDALDVPFDVVDGLAGRYTERWDERMRPRPKHARLITLADAEPRYDAIIGHNLTDLLEAKHLEGPRLLVLHVSLDHRVAQAGLSQPPEDLRETVARYLTLVGGHCIAVTERKRASWNLEAAGVEVDVVESFAEPDSYPKWTGEKAAGLRVANQISSREQYLWWDLHRAAFGDVPVTIVGHNPDMGVEAAGGWDDLKAKLASHRFFIHTADPSLEDGFNMAVMEAMATGLPILGNDHPTSAVKDGESGLLSDDPLVLAHHARRLIEDHALAEKLGYGAQEVARRRFSRPRFIREMRAALKAATHRWRARGR